MATSAWGVTSHGWRRCITVWTVKPGNRSVEERWFLRVSFLQVKFAIMCTQFTSSIKVFNIILRIYKNVTWLQSLLDQIQISLFFSFILSHTLSLKKVLENKIMLIESSLGLFFSNQNKTTILRRIKFRKGYFEEEDSSLMEAMSPHHNSIILLNVTWRPLLTASDHFRYEMQVEGSSFF